MNSKYPTIDRLIREWGQRAYHWRQMEDFTVKEKTAGDYVTTIDERLNDALSTEIARYFPADRVLSEEDPQSIRHWHSDYRRLAQ